MTASTSRRPPVVPAGPKLAARAAAAHKQRRATVVRRTALVLVAVVPLALSAIISMVQIGMQHGELSEREVTTGVGFIVLVSLCVWVTLDLNQPQGGMITISQEPMQRLLASLSQ